MKTIAIIAEYNPFHNGHLYMLNEAKKQTGSDFSIALMSGNFTQRGLPAICDKYTRSYMAAMSGIDLCLELPYVYATGSAHDFAYGAVSLLNKLNIIDYLCFGAESIDLDLFNQVADIIINEPESYQKTLKDEQKKGASFPLARQNAVIKYINETKNPESSYDEHEIKHTISRPNNILAIEYLAALKKTGSKIKPCIIQRKTSFHNDTSLSGDISSSSAIRTSAIETVIYTSASKNVKDIYKSTDISKQFEDCMPKQALECFANMFRKEYPLNPSSLMPFIQGAYAIHKLCAFDICDLNRSLSNKLKKTDLCIGYDDLVKALKSKDITETRINRALLHLITGYKNNDRDTFYKHGTVFYVCILSFKRASTALIKCMKEESSIPVITKKSSFEKIISSFQNIDNDIAKRMWELDLSASDLYRMLIYNSLGTFIENDFKTNIPIIED